MKRRQFISLTAAAWLATVTGGRATPAPRIIMFGDSLTEGYGLPPDQGLVTQLQSWLDNRNIAGRIINAGLSGDTTFGGRVRVNWSLRGKYDAVVIELGANDLLAGFPLPEVEKNLDTIVKRAKRGDRPVLLVGISPPQSAIKAERKQVVAMWQRLAARHEVALLPDLYAPLWQLPPDEALTLLQKDRLHLSDLGVALVVQDLGPLVAQLIDRIGAD